MGGNMTIDDLKHLDKRLRQIKDPYGTGWLAKYELVRNISGVQKAFPVCLSSPYYVRFPLSLPDFA